VRWSALDLNGRIFYDDGRGKCVLTQQVFRLDLASGKWEPFQPLKSLGGERLGIYQVISDSQNNLWMAEFTKGHIGKIDAKTSEVT
jgi:virginiamycin B lyase